METVADFILLGSKITEDGDCSHEIERRLLLGRKVMANLDRVFKSRDFTLPTKVCIVEDIVFPVVMYRCESWTIKKSEHRVQFSSVAQSCPILCDPMNHSTPGSLSITNSRSSPRLMFIESVMPSSHLILGCPLLLLPPIPPSIKVF